MSENRPGRHAFNPAAARTTMEETPLVREGRRERRYGVLVLAVAAAALVAGLLADVLNLAPSPSAWHPLTTLAIVSGGVFTVQGIRMIRNGRATLRDELRRQVEHRQQ